MVFTFIVPVKNGLAYTRALVESVTARNPGVEIEWVIVDSGSTDGTLEWAGALGSRVVHYQSTPFNYCAAVNAGIEVATGDLWIIANNDIEFRSTGDLERLERVFASWPLMGVVSPGRPAGKAELEFRHEGLNGACWVVRPDALQSWGGMPEAMSGYGYDEAYTLIQCWRRGYGFAWLTGWDVLHHGSVTFGPAAGNVTPALRRNLSRLLKATGSEDLDTAESPERIVRRLVRREQDRAPARLQVSPSGSATWFEQQGYANARSAKPGLADVPLVLGSIDSSAQSQWLPWLANELILQPNAPVVGANGWWAVREPEAGAGERVNDPRDWFPDVAAVGPAPPALMPPLTNKRPSLRQRLSAATHAWRARGRTLPDEW